MPRIKKRAHIVPATYQKSWAHDPKKQKVYHFDKTSLLKSSIARIGSAMCADFYYVLWDKTDPEKIEEFFRKNFEAKWNFYLKKLRKETRKHNATLQAAGSVTSAFSLNDIANFANVQWIRDERNVRPFINKAIRTAIGTFEPITSKIPIRYSNIQKKKDFFFKIYMISVPIKRWRNCHIDLRN